MTTMNEAEELGMGEGFAPTYPKTKDVLGIMTCGWCYKWLGTYHRLEDCSRVSAGVGAATTHSKEQLKANDKDKK